MTYASKSLHKGHTIEFVGKFEPSKYKNEEVVDVNGYFISLNSLSKLMVKEEHDTLDLTDLYKFINNPSKDVAALATTAEALKHAAGVCYQQPCSR
ncbi:hypothetical protein AGMMS49593_01730 [Endomicrobiia bacterium]|nr:hypothetical protein AGMMS49593_01730 [Endomicrobiia bacterium]